MFWQMWWQCKYIVHSFDLQAENSFSEKYISKHFLQLFPRSISADCFWNDLIVFWVHLICTLVHQASTWELTRMHLFAIVLMSIHLSCLSFWIGFYFCPLRICNMLNCLCSPLNTRDIIAYSFIVTQTYFLKIWNHSDEQFYHVPLMWIFFWVWHAKLSHSFQLRT